MDEFGQITSYEALQNKVFDLSRKLQAGQLIFLLGKNDLASIVAYLACIEARAVPLLLDSGLPKKSLSNLLDLYKPNLIFCQRNNSELEKLLKLVWAVDD